MRSYNAPALWKYYHVARSIIDVSVESICTTRGDLATSVRAYLFVMPDWPHLFPTRLIAFPAGNGKQMTDGGKTDLLINWQREKKKIEVDSRKYWRFRERRGLFKKNEKKRIKSAGMSISSFSSSNFAQPRSVFRESVVFAFQFASLGIDHVRLANECWSYSFRSDVTLN